MTKTEQQILEAGTIPGLGKADIRIDKNLLSVDLRPALEEIKLKESPFGLDLDALVNFDFDPDGLIQHIEVLQPKDRWAEDSALKLPQDWEEALLIFPKVLQEIEKGERDWLTIEDLSITITHNPRDNLIRIGIGPEEEANYYSLASEVIAGVGKESAVLKEIFCFLSPS